jgi:glucokinase
VDLGGTNIRVAYATDPSRLERRVSLPTPTTNARDIETAIVDAVSECARGERVDAIGIAAPGPLDHVRGIVHEAPNLSGFKEVPLAEDVGGRLGSPTFLDRDTVVAAFGEGTFGAARGIADWIYITISTGIGGAIVSEGRILRGVTGTAGEIGHFPIDPRGPRCGCGNIGCVEALASGVNIAKHYGAESAADVFAAWRSGDAKAQEIIERARVGLGAMAIGVVNLLNPRRIVVGGGITTGEPEFVFDAMRDAVREHAFAVPASVVEIVPAALGDDVGLVGSALMARERAGGRQPLGTARA